MCIIKECYMKYLILWSFICTQNPFLQLLHESGWPDLRFTIYICILITIVQSGERNGKRRPRRLSVICKKTSRRWLLNNRNNMGLRETVVAVLSLYKWRFCIDSLGNLMWIPARKITNHTLCVCCIIRKGRLWERIYIVWKVHEFSAAEQYTFSY